MTFEQIQENVRLSLTIPRGSLFKRPKFGHRFNELKNEPATEETRRKSEDYAHEALAWLLDIGRAIQLECHAFYDEFNRLIVRIILTSMSGQVVTFDRFVEVFDGE